MTVIHRRSITHEQKQISESPTLWSREKNLERGMALAQFRKQTSIVMDGPWVGVDRCMYVQLNTYTSTHKQWFKDVFGNIQTQKSPSECSDREGAERVYLLG